MHKLWMFLMVGAVMAFGTVNARAESKHWHEVASYSVDGKDAVEAGVDRPSVTFIKITCTDGSIVVNTLVVREGGNKKPFTVGKRIEKGDSHVIEIGETKATGFRISHDGRGSYVIHVK
jgi:hypothetical protein